MRDGSFQPLAAARVLNLSEYWLMDIAPCFNWYSCSPMEISPGDLPKTSLKWIRKQENDWVAGPAWFQMVSAHCKAGPVRAEITKAILDCSVGNIWGCSSIVREHCNRKPLHSSASPEKGAGRAMGLANRICEEELETTGEGAGAEGAGETGGFCNTFFNESTSTWKGSWTLILSILLGPIFCNSDWVGHGGKW